MKALLATCRFVLLPALVVVLLVMLARAGRPPPCGKEWVRLAIPTVAARTNSGAVPPVVSVWASNVGPRSVELGVWWFECRSKREHTRLAGNALRGVRVPLASGRSTRLEIDVPTTAVPVEDYLCCWQVSWMQCQPPLRRTVDSLGSWWYGLFELNWHSPSESVEYKSGDVFASNVEVAEYFRQMYGFTRAQWLEEIAQYESAKTQVTSVSKYGLRIARSPTAEEKAQDDAWLAFIGFCQASTASAQNAQSAASTNAALPHR